MECQSRREYFTQPFSHQTLLLCNNNKSRAFFFVQLHASIFVGKSVTKAVLDTKDLTQGMVTQDEKLPSFESNGFDLKAWITK